MQTTRQSLLNIITDGAFHSGESLSAALNVSQAEIWETISQLQQRGLGIESCHGLGYRLNKPIQLLDADVIRQGLSGLGLEYCRDIEILFETESTNTYLANRTRATYCPGDVVLAEYQSAGKGRRGNHWVSPMGGGIYLSLAWRSDKPCVAIGLLSLFIGVAVARTLTELGIQKIGLKWPNDIFINNKKLGGVLIEAQNEANSPVDLIIGIGINYDLSSNCKHQLDKWATDLQGHLTTELSRNEVISTLISHLFRILVGDSDQQRFQLLAEWRHYDCWRERKARLVLANEEIYGQLKGIDDSGFLLMSVNGQLRRYMSGEISLRIMP